MRMISEKDFVLINFVGRIKSSGKIFDLTEKDIADKEGVQEDGFNFSPVLVIPDSNYVLTPLAKSLVNRNVGEKYRLELKAKEAFGELNPKLLKVLGMKVFIENKINPSPGDLVMLDGKMATVQSVSGGRVMVNFNHPLAGKDLVYDIEVVKVLETSKEKCAAIFKHYSGNEPDEIDIAEDSVKIKSVAKIKPYEIDAIKTDIEKFVHNGLKVEIVAG